MNTSTLFPIIDSLSSTAGFAQWGVAPLRCLNEQAEYYHAAHERGDFANLEYLSRNIDKRLNPALLLEEIGVEPIKDSNNKVYTNCSILVFLAPYGRIGNTNENLSKTNNIKISRYAVGLDYHHVIKNKLNNIVSQLQTLEPLLKARVFTDSAPVLERAWAVEAGLGFVGKNNFLISKKCGIANFIGVILVNLPIAKVKNSEVDANEHVPTINKNSCGDCRRCLDACPSGALYSAYHLDARKCISYQTIENKELISNNETKLKLNGWLFGCDECMNACPWNNRNVLGWNEFINKNVGIEMLENSDFSIELLKSLSKQDFQKAFNNSPIIRCGQNKILNTLAYLKTNETNNTSRNSQSKTTDKL